MPYAWQRGFALAAVFVLCCLGGWLLHGRFASPPVSPATQIAAPPRLPQSGSVEAPVSVAERQPAPAPAMPPAPVVATPERPDAVTVTPGAMEDRCDDTPPVVEPDHYALLGEAPVTPAVMDEPMTGSQDAPAPVSPDCAVVAMLAETGY